MILENFRPGTMERLGYGWDQLHTRFSRLIYGAVSGFGHTGPESGKPAYDMVVQARGGVMSITGEEGGPPVRVGASIGDIVAGMYLVQGVLAALIARDRDGQGAKIDISMLDAQIAIQEHALAITTATGTPPVRTGARHPTITPFFLLSRIGRLFRDRRRERRALHAALCSARGARVGLGPAFRDERRQMRKCPPS